MYLLEKELLVKEASKVHVMPYSRLRVEVLPPDSRRTFDLQLECAAADAVLRDLIARDRVRCLPSGATSTLLDLSRVSTALASYVSSTDASPSDWLVVLDGMGRSLESTWHAAGYMSPGVDVLSLAMVKSEINARRLNAEVYDCVVRLNTAPNASS